ncbi:molybdopterin-dependent oxidoreductase, partial [candidate division KSB1 bacterium]|nr:molybdopterin-dependent oxidoreductase [candidate division KSB1 bacterium]
MRESQFLYDPDGRRHLVSRRDFLKGAGSLTVFFLVGTRAAEAQRGRDYPEDANAYLRIQADRITCYTGKIEMGQGIITSLAQMIADELDVAMQTIDMVMGDTDLCPYDSGTFGSRTTKYFGPALRSAGARAKAILLQMAADEWRMEADQLIVHDGVISRKDAPEARITYAELLKGQRIEYRHTITAQPEPLAAHSICGQPVRRSDALEKVLGTAKYAGDIFLPNMLYACVLRPPAHGARLKAVDSSALKDRADLLLVQEDDYIAVLADKPDVAEAALSGIKAEFDVQSDPRTDETLFEFLEKSATSDRIVTEKGDVSAGKNASATILTASYYNHYVAHAPLETHTA